MISVDSISTYISQYGLRLAFVVCVIVLGIFVTSLLCFIIKKILGKTKVDAAVVSFINAIVKLIMAIIIVFLSASILDLSTSSLIVSISTIALAVILALKDSFANLANGILIIINKPFKKGDHVKVNGVEGKVLSIKLLTIELITFDNARIVLPNSVVLTDNVINYSSAPVRRVDMTYTVAYGSDMDKVERVFKEVIENNDKILKSIEYSVYMSSHDSSAITYTVKVWVNNANYWDVLFGFPRLVYDAFEKNGITIPFNQLDVHVKQETAAISKEVVEIKEDVENEEK